MRRIVCRHSQCDIVLVFRALIGQLRFEGDRLGLVARRHRVQVFGRLRRSRHAERARSRPIDQVQRVAAPGRVTFRLIVFRRLLFKANF